MKTKIAVTLFGTCIVLISIYYISILFIENKTSLLAWRPQRNDFVMLSVAAIIYGLANYLLAFAWIILLDEKQKETVLKSKLLGIYGKSQIAKYIPGNVAHIGGRHLLANAAGIGHRILASAAIYEIAGLLTAATFVSLSGLPSYSSQISILKWTPVLTPILLIGYFLLPKILTIFHLKERAKPRRYSQLLLPLLYYIVFFLFAGIALMVLSWKYLNEIDSTYLIAFLTAFAISWSAGFVTPGSPSGIGIRESLLIILLTPSTGTELAIILAFIFRIVTVLGDLFFMLLTFLGELICSPRGYVSSKL